jgi:tetratricopeptide (TPR) repeat protein
MWKVDTFVHASVRRGLMGAGSAAVFAIALGNLARGVETAVPPRTEVGAYSHACLSPLVPAGELEGRPPLLDDLGTLTYPVTTKSAEAQAYFDQGMRLSYAFNHAEARRAFQEAQRLDPTCAMCFWGEALVLGPNINMPMDPSANAPALVALARAEALASAATEKERDLIAALSARYSDAPAAERAALDTAYADSMGALAQEYPQDLGIAVLYAEALMDISPWDYWDGGGARPKGKTAEIVATLERVLAGYPDHPGAIHLYIHVVEASTTPQRAARHADRLAALMPGAGHIVHMPSHIYYRLGRYKDALAANKAAVAVDERYIDRVKGSSLYMAMYYPHNVHFLMAAAQMAGDGPTALAAAQKLARLVPDEVARTVPLAQPIKAAPYFADVLFGTPESTLALAKPEGIPYVEAMWHYARGTALVRKGDLAGAAAEAEAIATLARTGDFSALDAVAIPSVPVLDLAREVLLGRIAQAKGDLSGAIGHVQRAAELQDGLAYMEPPYWYYPVRQSLGAMLLQVGRVEEAEAAFRSALKKTPNNGWALFGLAETLRAKGDAAAAMEAEAQLAKAWAGDRAALDLARL